MGKTVLHVGVVMGLCSVGCSKPVSKPLLSAEKYTVVEMLDFSPYAAKGFLITPEEYRGDYDAQGFLEIHLYPKVQEQESARPIASGTGPWGVSSASRGDTLKTRVLAVEAISAEEALAQLYEEAVKLGADALMQFKMERAPISLGPYQYTGIRLSGFAILRRGAFK